MSRVRSRRDDWLLALSEDPSWQWDLSAGLDAVTPSLVAPGNGLDELAVPKVQRSKVFGCPSGRQRSRVHKPAKERPALRVRVVVRTGRAGEKTEACLRQGPGTTYELFLQIPDGYRRQLRLIGFRESGRDFNERERFDLELLTPHIEGSYRRGERQRVLLELTPRQYSLLRRVSEGWTNQQIARRMGLAEAPCELI
jgi:hypothetical protein